MQRRSDKLRLWLALASLISLAPIVLAVPLGYRYIGSRVVSEGRIVYWYWDVDHVEIGPYDVSFVARMYARAVDVNQERPYVAVIRCDSRTYRQHQTQNRYEAIDEGEPIHAVWRAGCDAGKAVSMAVRHARLNASATTAATGTGGEAGRPSSTTATPTATDDKGKNLVAATTTPPVAAAPAKSTAAAPAPASGDANDERRADRCVRFAEGKASQFGEATVTNTCTFAIEVALCYKGGGGGIYDCPARAKGMRMESLSPGATRNLPEYRRDRHKGIASVSCKGTMGAVMPLLNGDGGKTGCY